MLYHLTKYGNIQYKFNSIELLSMPSSNILNNITINNNSSGSDTRIIMNNDDNIALSKINSNYNLNEYLAILKSEYEPINTKLYTANTVFSLLDITILTSTIQCANLFAGDILDEWNFSSTK